MSIEFHTTGESLNKVLLPLLVADSSSLGVGELEITPVSAAIARYLGIDLTAEGRAARNRRGIALVVHGAPLSGKTATAVSLAKMYGAALLTVDGVVMEAITSGNTSAGKNVLVVNKNQIKKLKRFGQSICNLWLSFDPLLSPDVKSGYHNVK